MKMLVYLYKYTHISKGKAITLPLIHNYTLTLLRMQSNHLLSTTIHYLITALSKFTTNVHYNTSIALPYSS